MFVHVANRIYNTDIIRTVDCEKYLEEGTVKIYFTNGSSETVDGPESTTLIMTLCPSFIEGKEAKYARFSWSVHNMIGHPLMQICSWFHLTELGIRIHDATVPSPLPKDEQA